MAAPVIVAGLTAADLIALGGIAASTATAVGTLPDDLVTIGSISISIATGGELYVGDRFVITGEFDVSYGEVSGSEGTIKIEIIEEGKGVIKTFPQIQAQSPKEHISVRMVGKAIHHGKQFYHIKITATGEEDLSWAPTGDTEVTKTGVSSTVPIDIKKPISITTTLLTPSVNHGDRARAIMRATNHSESNGRIVTQLAYIRSFPNDPHALSTTLRAGQTNLTVIDFSAPHTEDNHEDEKIFYFEPVKHIYHNHQIKSPVGDFYYTYDQIYPDRETVFPPLAITCKGTAERDRRVGYIPAPDNSSFRSEEYAYSCSIKDENEDTLECGAMLFDGYGNTVVAEVSGSGEELKFRGKLCGEVATLEITPTFSAYGSHSTVVFLDKEYLGNNPDIYVFFPAKLPAIRGVVFLQEENIAIAGALVTLVGMDDTVISESITDGDGKFELSADRKSFGDGKAVIKTKLPWDITFDWEETLISNTIALEKALEEGARIPINAAIKAHQDWAEISGKVVFKDYLSDSFKPVKEAEIIVTNEMDEIVDTASTDANGNYSFGVKPGGYFVEVANAEELGYESNNKAFLNFRSSRSTVDVTLRIPTPILERKTSNFIKWKGSNTPEDKLAVFENGVLVKEIGFTKNSFYQNLKEIELTREVSVAIRRGDDYGRWVFLKI